MPKRDTVAAIKAANSVELDETAYTQAELDQLLALSGDQAGFDALRTQFDDDGVTPNDNTPEVTVADDSPRKKVKVNLTSDKIAEGAGFIHPVSKQLITGERVVSVPSDDWTDTMIRDKTLTEVR
jgi:hypothetical protein